MVSASYPTTLALNFVLALSMFLMSASLAAYLHYDYTGEMPEVYSQLHLNRLLGETEAQAPIPSPINSEIYSQNQLSWITLNHQNFSLEYPNNWSVMTIEASQAGLLNSNQEQLVLEIYNQDDNQGQSKITISELAPPKTDLKTWLIERYDPFADDWVEFSVTTLNLDSWYGYTIRYSIQPWSTLSPTGESHYYLEDSDRLIFIRHQSSSSELETINHILHSLHRIDKNVSI